DKELADFDLTREDLSSLESAGRIRNTLAEIQKRHPVARDFFVLSGGALHFPVLQSPPPVQLTSLLSDEAPPIAGKFSDFFSQGENFELRLQRPDQALSAYRKGYELPVSISLKALALSRVARCLQKIKQPRAAKQAYLDLLQQYAEVYDPFHRPYGLVAGLELANLSTSQESSWRLLTQLHRDLLKGRWELSAEQIDYFLEKIEERLEQPSSQGAETPYLAHFTMARDLQAGFQHHGPLNSNQIYAYAFSRAGNNYQIYYTLLPGGKSQDRLLGFFVDLNWIESQLLPQYAREVRPDENLEVTFNFLREVGRRRADSEPALAEAHIRFKALFPFWDLSIRRTSQQSSARREMLFFAGTTVLILCVLGLGVFLLIRDVSRELELGRLRADFISGVSHEVKTPVTLIRLYGETLLCDENASIEERRDYYQIITRESERLTHIIEKVLNFSRIERGEREYQLREGDLGATIGRTLEVYRQYLERRGFTVKTDLADHLPPVRFDSQAISQAVLNLMDNAAKYSGESKWIGIRLWSVDNSVILELEDKGIGIPANERERIFQRFYRSGATAEKGGYGLGLFLVRHIMDAHAGSVEVESEVGKGSRFRLSFPVCSQTEVRDSEAPSLHGETAQSGGFDV
ncbi:HAMP domain-containing histidine kinase, partial [Acidobacteria bacterium AH-259-L09]|nr:HAMP domain-containing histidine kinase [Acidobacteria bacterium AH-259-L09]